MKDVVESLIGIIEFLIQGSLAAAVALYFAAFFHPVPVLLRKYLADLREALSGPKNPTASVSPIVVVLACASLYFLGVVSNIVNYWVLAPVHSSVIQEVRDEHFERRGDAEFVIKAFPLLLTRNDRSRMFYNEYLKDDATWRDKKLESLNSILPSLRTYIRIIRGVTVAGLAVLLIAVLKSFFGLLIVVACAPWKESPNSVAILLYRYFVSYVAYKDKRIKFTVSDIVKDSLKHMVVPNLILAVLGIVVFSVALLSYRTIEQEYQLLVMFGASMAG